MNQEIDTDRLFARARPVRDDGSTRLLVLMTTLVVLAIIWANIAELETQVRSEAEVIVSSRSQVIQAVDGGTLKKLYVKEGQAVEKGELLAELDQARFEASSAEMRSKILSLKANVQRITAELEGRNPVFSADVTANPALVNNQMLLHKQRLRQQREQKASIQETIALTQQELTSLESLAETGDASYNDTLQLRRQLVDLEAELTNRNNEIRREAQAKVVDFQAQLEQTFQVLKQRDEVLQAAYIVAPMAGIVKNVSITTLGAVLGRGAELMQIVPSDDPLLIEARVLSGDVASIRTGLKANIKLTAYDFTVYGSIRGVVTYVSPDTIDADLQRGEEPYYRVLVSIEKYPDKSGKKITLIPGMKALTEIITGTKTVAQYIMKPLRRGSAAAMTEA